MVTFRGALRFWVKLGFISFGGPAGQIAIMHREIVEGKRWITEEQFMRALNFCMILPGPEAQQLVVYIGWLLHGTPGGIAAGLFFVIPSVFMFIFVGAPYVEALAGNRRIQAALTGVTAAVVGVILNLAVFFARRVLLPAGGSLDVFALVLAALSFAILLRFRAPIQYVVAAGALAGMAWRLLLVPGAP